MKYELLIDSRQPLRIDIHSFNMVKPIILFAYESRMPGPCTLSRIQTHPPLEKLYRVISGALFYDPVNRNEDWNGDGQPD